MNFILKYQVDEHNQKKIRFYSILHTELFIKSKSLLLLTA
jgi:hypothetical protein